MIPSIGIKGRTGEELDNGSGKYMLACAQADYVYASKDYGVTWNTITSLGVKVWNSANMSSTAKYQYVACALGYLYRSSDFGTTWTELTFMGRRWWGTRSIAVSQTGQYVTITPYLEYVNDSYWDNNYHYYTSSDFGVTWTSRTYGQQTATVAMDGTGQHQRFLTGDTKSKVSSDYGLTLTDFTTFSGYWDRISVGRSNQYICLSSDGNNPKTTTDGGTSWITSVPGYSLRPAMVTNSGNGLYIYLHCDAENSIRRSSSGGGSYSLIETFVQPVDMATSYTGQYVAYVEENSYINVSSDYGANFDNKGLRKQYASIAISR